MSFEKVIKINVLIAVSYIFLYFFSLYLWKLESFYGNLLFLPHSIRIIAALIFGWLSFPGLLLGHLFCAISFDNNTNYLLVLYGSSSIFILIELLKSFQVFDLKNFKNVNFVNIIFIVFLASIFNSVGSFIIFDFYNQINSFNFIFSYFVGDFLGGFIGLYFFLKFFYKYF